MLLGLSDEDLATGRLLQDKVIGPHVDTILDAFYARLLAHPEAKSIIARGFTLESLKRTQRRYLLSLGVEFTSEDYFEERLNIGYIHMLVGVQPSLYQCAYSLMQELLIGQVPPDDPDARPLVDFIIKITNLDMSLAIESYQGSVIEGLERSLASLQQETSNLTERIATDALTGSLSRQRILELLTQRINEISPQHPVAVLMVDLDHFKHINDHYGHTVGDRVLVDVAQRMRNAVRRVNAVGRYGGEEFLIVLSDTSPEQARLVGERLRERIAVQPVNVNGYEIPVTISVGIAFSDQTIDMLELINNADQALYRAKRLGRNRAEFHEGTPAEPRTVPTR
jgi:diguanylate cyclase (GGDEF)-like protein